MAEPRTHILCTRPVDPALLRAAAEKNVQVDVAAFIETEPIVTIEVQQEVEAASAEQAAVIFTSMNAVDAVTSLLDGFVPGWQIYCIGHKTREQVVSYFGEELLAGTAENAAALAERIIEEEIATEFIFFCGNNRRDEMPEMLAEAGLSVSEIVVYETTEVNRKIDKTYDGILFFSPSAADSFFKSNRPASATILFAIGTTTANQLRKYSGNTVITGTTGSKSSLLQLALDHFADSRQ